MNKIMGWKTSGFKAKFYFRDNYIYTTFTVEKSFYISKNNLKIFKTSLFHLPLHPNKTLG